MAFTRIKPSGWAFGEKLTSAQMNLLDQDHANSVDVATLSLGGSYSIARINPHLASVDDVTLWGTQTQQNGYITVATGGLGAVCYWPLRIANGATLTEMSVVIEPPGGHSALPVAMPRFRVASVQANGTVTNEIAYVTDASANTTAYQTVHAISATGLSLSVTNNTKRYIVFLETESSTNALVGTKVYMNHYVYAVTALDRE